MHESLMTALKQRQDEAAVAIKAMEKLSSRLEQKVEELQRHAQQKQTESDTWNMWGIILAPLTLGISAVVTAGPAHHFAAEARSALAQGWSASRRTRG
jgi:hypothetical protein